VPRPRRTARPAFSLTELVFAIGLIAILVAILVPALLGIRAAGDRSATQAGLRQMAQAYTSYASDHDGALMPGYVLDSARVPLRARDANGRDISGTEDAAPYVWRLAEYLDDWRVTTTGYGEGLGARLTTEVEDGVVGGATAGPDQLGLARVPAIGMNTVWVGGDDRHFTVPGAAGPDVPGNRDPWTNRFDTQAVTSVSGVRNTSRLVVFAPTRRWNDEAWGPGQAASAAAGERLGAPALMPPRFPDADGDLQSDGGAWDAARIGGDFESVVQQPNDAGSWDPDADAGVPVFRSARDEVLPVVHFDGSFSSVPLLELRNDPRYWNPQANQVIIGDED
jgi:type II secretory pathway pseudopilin PulG